jgi:hypothetical protein
MTVTNVPHFWMDRWVSGGMWIWTLGGVILLAYIIVSIFKKK